MGDSGMLVPGRLFEVVAEVPRDVEGFVAAVFGEAGAPGWAWPRGDGVVELRCPNAGCPAGSVRLELLPGHPARRARPEPACPLCGEPLTFSRRLRAVVLVPALVRRPGEGDGDGGQRG